MRRIKGESNERQERRKSAVDYGCRATPLGSASLSAAFGSRLSFLVFVVPNFWLPKFDLVSIGINEPKERAVLVILWSLMDRNSSGVELPDHFVHIVDSIVDHER